jgi:uncharacterized ParB-like nuclease family protein
VKTNDLAPPALYRDYVNSVVSLSQVLLAPTSPVAAHAGWAYDAIEKLRALGPVVDEREAELVEWIGGRLGSWGRGWLGDIGDALRLTAEQYVSGYPITDGDFENAEDRLDELMRLVDRLDLAMPDDIVIVGQDAPTLPISRFNDADITANDFPRWGAALAWFTMPGEAAAFERLRERILESGLRKPVDLLTMDGRTFVSDGHHRVEALRQLGRDVPVRWREMRPDGRLSVRFGVPPLPEEVQRGESAGL